MAQVKLLCVAVLVLLCVLQQCSALKCYECTECEGVERGSIEQCDGTHDVCMKIKLGPFSIKKCGYRTQCLEGDVELNLMDSVKGEIVELFSSVVSGGKGDGGTQVIHCCRTDYCNNAQTLTTTTALLMPSLLLLGCTLLARAR